MARARRTTTSSTTTLTSTVVTAMALMGGIKLMPGLRFFTLDDREVTELIIALRREKKIAWLGEDRFVGADWWPGEDARRARAEKELADATVQD